MVNPQCRQLQACAWHTEVNQNHVEYLQLCLCTEHSTNYTRLWLQNICTLQPKCGYISWNDTRYINNKLSCCRQTVLCLVIEYLVVVVVVYLYSASRSASNALFPKSLKVIRNDILLQGMHKSILVFHCNYVCMLYRFTDIQRQIMAWPWNMDQGSRAIKGYWQRHQSIEHILYRV